MYEAGVWPSPVALVPVGMMSLPATATTRLTMSTRRLPPNPPIVRIR